MIEIKNKFWLVKEKEKRFLFNTWDNAIIKWIELGEQSGDFLTTSKDLELYELWFSVEEGCEFVHFKQVSWKNIAYGVVHSLLKTSRGVL